jgi:hypothetical protein
MGGTPATHPVAGVPPIRNQTERTP